MEETLSAYHVRHKVLTDNGWHPDQHYRYHHPGAPGHTIHSHPGSKEWIHTGPEVNLKTGTRAVHGSGLWPRPKKEPVRTITGRTIGRKVDGKQYGRGRFTGVKWDMGGQARQQHHSFTGYLHSLNPAPTKVDTPSWKSAKNPHAVYTPDHPQPTKMSQTKDYIRMQNHLEGHGWKQAKKPEGFRHHGAIPDLHTRYRHPAFPLQHMDVVHATIGPQHLTSMATFHHHFKAPMKKVGSDKTARYSRVTIAKGGYEGLKSHTAQLHSAYKHSHIADQAVLGHGFKHQADLEHKHDSRSAASHEWHYHGTHGSFVIHPKLINSSSPSKKAGQFGWYHKSHQGHSLGAGHDSTSLLRHLGTKYHDQTEAVAKQESLDEDRFLHKAHQRMHDILRAYGYARGEPVSFGHHGGANWIHPINQGEYKAEKVTKSAYMHNSLGHRAFILSHVAHPDHVTVILSPKGSKPHKFKGTPESVRMSLEHYHKPPVNPRGF